MQGLRLALIDYVKPSLHGTTWGLGGTCLNVGCVPKKIMHTSNIYFKHFLDTYNYGWNSYNPI